MTRDYNPLGQSPKPADCRRFPVRSDITRVAADVSRRHLGGGQNAPTDVGGYTRPANRAECEIFGLGRIPSPVVLGQKGTAVGSVARAPVAEQA